MKDSDLKKEKLKKAAIVGGLAVGASGATAGTAYAANALLSDDAPLPIEETPIVDEDVPVDYEEPVADDFLATPQPVYNVSVAPAPSAPAPVVVPVSEVDEVELIVDEAEPVSFNFDSIVSDNPIATELTSIYMDSGDAAPEVDFAAVYVDSNTDHIPFEDDEMIALGFELDLPEIVDTPDLADAEIPGLADDILQ